MIVSRREEFVTRASAPSDCAIAREKRVNQQFPGRVVKPERAGVRKFGGALRGRVAFAGNGRFIHAMQQPGFSERGVGADHAVEDEQRTMAGHVDDFTREAPQLVAGICVARIAHRVMVVAGFAIDHPHGREIPEFPRTVPIVAVVDGVPVTGGVHPLSAVIGRRQQIVGPEEFLGRIVYQHRVVSDGAAIVIQIMRTLDFGVVGSAVDGRECGRMHRRRGRIRIHHL